MLKQRLKNLQINLKDGEAALIKSDINRLYFTNFKSSAGVLLVTNKAAFLLIDFRYFEKAKKEISHLEVLLAEKLYAQITEILKRENISRVLIESDTATVDSIKALKENLSEFEISEADTLSKEIKNMRSIKSQEEIENIKQAQKITDDGFSHILEFISVGKTEKEIALELEFFMRKKGSEGVSFDFIVVSGKNSSLPHGVPTDKKIENGDFITLDFGAVVNGYRSDMTRTVAVGNITEKQKEVYNIVLSSQKAALSEIKPQIMCKDIDKIARDIISNNGYGKCFGHGLGHSVGLEIHENPAFNTRDETILTSGMIMTVEPGIYIENEFGVRIEDMVLITDNGFENLTKSPKELIII